MLDQARAPARPDRTEDSPIRSSVGPFPPCTVRGDALHATLPMRNDNAALVRAPCAAGCIASTWRSDHRRERLRDGLIQESRGHLFVTARSSQAEALGAFKAWLRTNMDRPEPDLLSPEGRLLLTKESAQPMLYWMRRWRAAVDQARR